MSKDPAKNREAVKRHYENNKTYYLEKNRKARQRKAEYIKNLRGVPCADCGGEYPYYVMEFDHLGEKLYPIASMTTKSWQQIKTELAKCEVVCANCHSIRTHERRASLVE